MSTSQGNFLSPAPSPVPWRYSIQANGRSLAEYLGDVQIDGGIVQTNSGEVNVKSQPFNAKGDNVTDDAAAIQAAITFAISIGATVYFPAGRYIIGSPLTVDLSAVTSAFDIKRCNLRGDGAGITHLLYSPATATTMLTVKGAAGAPLNTYFSMSGIYLLNNNANPLDSVGLALQAVAYAAFAQIAISNFDYGVDAKDLLSSTFDACRITFNRRGFRGAFLAVSPPNAITFKGCSIAANSEYGLDITGGSCIAYLGGSIESNGIGGVAADRYGIKMTDSCTGGATGLALDGVFVEGNEGRADVWLVQTTGKASHKIEGCSFTRISNVNFVTNNIRLDTSVGATNYCAIVGNGFRALGTYVENAARPYIDGLTNGLGTWDTFIGAGNFYGDRTVSPYQGPMTHYGDGALVRARFTVAAGVLTAGIRQKNVASIVRNSIGNFTINFSRALPNNQNSYCFAFNAMPLFPVIFAESTTALTIATTSDIAGAVPVDPALFTVCVFGDGVYT